MWASRVGRVEVVQALLEGGADPNIAEEVSVGVHTSNTTVTWALYSDTVCVHVLSIVLTPVLRVHNTTH